ncbi:MAG: hypothetical protein P8Z79_06605 [Sedimentisphaerales bacterium]
MVRKRIIAAIVLIVTEDLNALRILLKSLTDLTSRSVFSYKKG